MRSRLLSAAALGCCAVLGLSSLSLVAAQDQTAPTASTADWTPTLAGLTGYNSFVSWADEFSPAAAAGSTVRQTDLDGGKWTAATGPSQWNHELHANVNDEKHVALTDQGTMRLYADKVASQGRDYSAARISTGGHVLFGRGLFAARVKLPKGQGVGGSFWLLSSTPGKYVEIRIASLIGGYPSADGGAGNGDDRVVSSVAWFQRPSDGAIVRPGLPSTTMFESKAKLADEMHIYWVEWTDTEIWAGMNYQRPRKIASLADLGLDGSQRASIEFGLTVGGDWAGKPDDSLLPVEMQVDWVRVWNRANQAGPTAVSSGAPSSSFQPGAGSADQTPVVSPDSGSAIGGGGSVLGGPGTDSSSATTSASILLLAAVIAVAQILAMAA